MFFPPRDSTRQFFHGNGRDYILIVGRATKLTCPAASGALGDPQTYRAAEQVQRLVRRPAQHPSMRTSNDQLVNLPRP
jgi:hypothetical protein